MLENSYGLVKNESCIYMIRGLEDSLTCWTSFLQSAGNTIMSFFFLCFFFCFFLDEFKHHCQSTFTHVITVSGCDDGN